MMHAFDIRNSAFGIRAVPPKGNANFAWVQHFIQRAVADKAAEWQMSNDEFGMAN